MGRPNTGINGMFTPIEQALSEAKWLLAQELSVATAATGA